MPFCHECGKPVADKAKFCRNCGASQAEGLPESSPAPGPAAAPAPKPVAVPEPAPAPEPAPEPAAVPAAATVPGPAPEKLPEPGSALCRVCGGPLAPDEKFCGNCGAKAGEAAPAAPAPSPGIPSAVCPACNTPYAPGTKFCGTCGATISVAAVAAPAPAPAAAPFPVTAPAPGGVRLCTACGNPIKPGDKFCSKCLVIVKDTVPAAPAAIPVAPAVPVPPAPAPVPAAAAPGGVRLCTACGNPIKPGDKFCSKCLVIVKDTVPAAAPAPAPAAAAGAYVCASCNSPLSGNEKFCGVCGGPAIGARPAAVPPAPAAAPAGKVCASCGAPVSDTTKFCGGCGAPVGASFPAGTVAAPAAVPAPAGGEEILGIIPNAKKMKMMGMAWDSYTLIVTGRRMVIAQLTTAMLNTAVAEAQAKAKAEGKGFFGIMGDQLSASFGFAKRYETMSPDTALAETPGNFAIDNSRITSIKVSEIRSNNDDGSSNQLRLNIESMDGRFEYVIVEDDRFTTLLQNVYGDRVKMPFGLFKAGPVRIKFF